MKAIILFFFSFAFSSFSFSHELPTLKQVKEDIKKAEAEAEKLCSKRDVICKRGMYKPAVSKGQHPMGRSRAEGQAQNEWARVCRQSNNPSIQQARNKLNDIRQKIKKMEQESTVGRNYTYLEKTWREKALSLDTQEGREHYQILSDAKDDWFAFSRGVNEERLKAWDVLYGDKGVCQKDTPDPDVYRAYEKWQAITSKCEEAEWACIEKHFDILGLIIDKEDVKRALEPGRIEIPSHFHFPEKVPSATPSGATR